MVFLRRLSRPPRSGAVVLAMWVGTLIARGSDAVPVVVVTKSGVEAYAAALEGLRGGLAQAGQEVAVIDLARPEGIADLGRLGERGALRLVVAVGVEATQAVVSQRLRAPWVSTMTLHAPSKEPRPTTTVSLDAPLSRVLAELRRLFPGKTRVGILDNPSQPRPEEPMEARARQLGFTVRVVPCARPEDLLPALLSLRGRVDFVLTFPDAALYNSATVRPLILASLENRLPIVGFSASFVRAGAALGVYPDYRDVGRQTADVVRRLLAHEARVPDESPRRLSVAVNAKVLRLVGLETAALHDGSVEVLQ